MIYQTCLYCKYECCIYVYIYSTMYSDTPARGPNEFNKTFKPFLSCIGKLFTSVINERLYNYLTQANLLGSEQAGFRAKHSTLDHIFALQILSNFYINNGKQLYCAFVDYSKAFDFVNRTYLWQKLLYTNVNGKILNVIRNMYKNAKSHISLKKLLFNNFQCQVNIMVDLQTFLRIL